MVFQPLYIYTYIIYIYIYIYIYTYNVCLCARACVQKDVKTGTSFSPRKWHLQTATMRSGAFAESLIAATWRTRCTFRYVALERTTGTGSRGPGQQHAIGADLEGLGLAKGIVARAHIFALRLLHHQPRFRRFFYRLPRRMVGELKKPRSNDAPHRTAAAAAACRRLPARWGHAAAARPAETRARPTSPHGVVVAPRRVARCVTRVCAGRAGAHGGDRTRGTHGAGRGGSRSPARRACIPCALCPAHPCQLLSGFRV
jgi:hypothetical protein